MKVHAESYGHAVILILEGELTEDSLGAFQQAVDHQLEGKEVIDLALDLEKVSFMDSASLEYLLDLQDRLAERMGRVKLVKPDPNTRKILEITRLEPMFEILTDVAEAVKVREG